MLHGMDIRFCSLHFYGSVSAIHAVIAKSESEQSVSAALLFTAFITLELAYVVFKGLLSRNKPFLDVLRLQYGSLFEVFLRIGELS